MKKKSDEDKKVVIVALVAGIVGIGALSVYLALRKKQTSLDNIGKVVSNLGEILENHDVAEPDVLKDFGKKLHKNEDTVGSIVDWIATGISLWKKFKN
jgi:hypothetical protein